MDIDVTTMAGKKSGKVSISDTIFGLEPRADIIARMVRYQRAKARQGTHQTKGRSDVDKTGARMYRQKGTGGARHHSQAAPQFRGGGKAHGPQSRDHSHDLTKKFRALALRHALSAKAKDGSLMIMDELAAKDPKTAALRTNIGKLGIENALMIGGAELLSVHGVGMGDGGAAQGPADELHVRSLHVGDHQDSHLGQEVEGELVVRVA